MKSYQEFRPSLWVYTVSITLRETPKPLHAEPTRTDQRNSGPTFKCGLTRDRRTRARVSLKSHALFKVFELIDIYMPR